MNDSKKIEELLHHFRMKQKDFAEKCDFESDIISSIKRDKCKISLKVATKILKAFPEVNRSWLLDGEGEMIKKTVNQTIIGDNSSGIQNIGNNVKVGDNSNIYQNDMSAMVEMLKNKDNIIQDILKRNEKLQERLFELQDKLLQSQDALLSYIKTDK